VNSFGTRPDYAYRTILPESCDDPIFGEDGYPVQHRGVVDVAPGLYFLGLPFQHTFFSETVGGVGEDARHVADHLADRARNASRDRVS